MAGCGSQDSLYTPEGGEGRGEVGVLITRPEHQAAETARRVAALGYRPILAPMLQVHRLSAELPDDAGALLITSANAVPSLPAWARNRPVLAVGDATAALIRRAGFPHVLSAEGDAQALAATTRRHVPPGIPLLLLAGKDQGADLAEVLSDSGWPVTRAKVYDTVPATTLPPDATAALRQDAVHAALFFSARTAFAFIDLVLAKELGPHLAHTDACAISPRAAHALGRLAWRQIRIAAQPTQDAILALLQ
jgi:uroporphyrinogen-III synthase